MPLHAAVAVGVCLFVGAALAGSLVLSRQSMAEHRSALRTEFQTQFTPDLAAFGNFFARRSRALRASADALSGLPAVPSAALFRRVRAKVCRGVLPASRESDGAVRGVGRAGVLRTPYTAETLSCSTAYTSG